MRSGAIETADAAADDLDRSIRFLEGIGIPVRDEQLGTSFFNGISIKGGMIRLDRSKLRKDWPLADLFHEAGHIAVTPALFREQLPDDADALSALYDAYFESHPMAFSGDAEDPVARAILQSGEQEAIAWSYAATVAAGVDPRLVFPKAKAIFSGAGPTLRTQLEHGMHPGIQGLIAGGMTQSPRIRGNGAPFPQMVRWLQA
jgi:hypothetical protein